jgi:hypothetical protein
VCGAGAFRVTGSIEFDGVSAEQFWVLNCEYVDQSAMVIQHTVFVSPAHVEGGSQATCRPTVAWGIWEQVRPAATVSVQLQFVCWYRGISRVPARAEACAGLWGAVQNAGTARMSSTASRGVFRFSRVSAALAAVTR